MQFKECNKKVQFKECNRNIYILARNQIIFNYLHFNNLKFYN